MAYIVEPLPSAPLDAAIVLHVRSHCRAVIHESNSESDKAGMKSAVELLFGIDSEVSKALDVSAIIRSKDPIARVADAIGHSNGRSAVELGHDAQFVETCIAWLADRVRAEAAYKDIFASDPETLLVLSNALDLAAACGRLGRLPATLICGETGTGKELLALAMHQISSRAGLTDPTRYVPVHIAGLSPDFVNDELFGHKKGGFTGANSDRTGRIEQANGGTLLIDEVGDLSREAQLRLLRVLEDGRVSKIGEENTSNVRVRVLAATNRDLEATVREGNFRIDLLHRLRRGWLVLPPLRGRSGWQHEIVDRMIASHGHNVAPRITRSARDALTCHDWPGNLRELDGALEIAVSNAGGGTVRLDHLPRHLQAKYLNAPLTLRAAGTLCDDMDFNCPDRDLIKVRIARLREQITDATVNGVDEDVERVQGLLRFQESIPDRSEVHLATVERLRVLTSTAAKKGDLSARSHMWRMVDSSGLPALVSSAVQREAHALEKKVAELERKIDEQAHELDLGADPWWKFIIELGGLPIVDEEIRPKIQQFVVFASRLLVSMSPELADKVFATVRAGGVAAVRAAVAEFMHDKAEPVPTYPPNPRDLSVQDWRDLRQRFPKRIDAARRLDCNVKTISKHVIARLGEDPWASRSGEHRPINNKRRTRRPGVSKRS